MKGSIGDPDGPCAQDQPATAFAAVAAEQPAIQSGKTPTTPTTLQGVNIPAEPSAAKVETGPAPRQLVELSPLATTNNEDCVPSEEFPGLPGPDAGFLSDPFVWQAHLAKQTALDGQTTTVAQRLGDIVGFEAPDVSPPTAPALQKDKPALPPRRQPLLDVLKGILANVDVTVVGTSQARAGDPLVVAPIITASR